MRKLKDNLFILGILLIGLLTVFPYGVHLDQNMEQMILFSNIKEYLLHLPKEVPLVQEMNEFGILEISQNIEKDHGIALYYPAFVVWYINQISLFWGNVFWHAYTFIIVYLGIVSLFFLSMELYQNRKIAVFTTLLFFLTPRMFAESHYNNKDMVLLSMTFCILYYGYRIIKNPSIKNILLFSFTGAFTFNVKIIGAWVFGVLGLYILVYFMATKQFNILILYKMFLCIGLWLVVFVLITPACWGNLFEFIEYIFGYAVNFSRWNGYILFDGNIINHELTGIPRKYLPFMIILTVPLGILMLGVLGGIFLAISFLKMKKSKLWIREGYLIVTLLVGIIPLLYAVVQATPLYNGWRHFYFTYASLIMSAGYAVYCLRVVAERCGKERFVNYCGSLYISLLCIGVMLNYPQEHSYYNFLAGENVVSRFELDYWNMSMKQAIEVVIDDLDDNEIGTVTSINSQTLSGIQLNYQVIPSMKRKRIELITDTEGWSEADYIIINTTYAIMCVPEEYMKVKEKFILVDSISSYGNVICEVYKKNE